MKLQRREVIGGLATASALGLAGCTTGVQGDGSAGASGSDAVVTDPSEIEFPEGFSERGVEDAEVAFGPESTFMATESARVDYTITETRRGADGSSSQTLDLVLRTNQLQKRTHATRTLGSDEIQQYVGDGRQYIRIESGDEPTYQVQRKQYEGRAEYLLGALSTSVDGAAFDSVSQAGDRITYTLADLDGIGETHALRERGAESLTEVDFELEVTTDGLVRTLRTNYSRDEAGISVRREFRYSEFDAVTVQEPAWLPAAKETAEETTPTPSVAGEVTWKETDAGVEVILMSITEGDRALVFVGPTRYGVIEVGSEPTVIPTDAYTDETGGTKTIRVVAPTDSGQLSVVEWYTPQ